MFDNDNKWLHYCLIYLLCYTCYHVSACCCEVMCHAILATASHILYLPLRLFNASFALVLELMLQGFIIHYGSRRNSLYGICTKLGCIVGYTTWF